MDGPNQIKGLRGGVLEYDTQATSRIDAEIGKKEYFWMETELPSSFRNAFVIKGVFFYAL